MKKKESKWYLLGALALGLLFLLAIGYVVMLLWNWLIPDLLGLKTISYWMALALVILFYLIYCFVEFKN